MPTVRAPWSGASFLLYAGGLAILVAIGYLLSAIDSDHGDGAFVGWCALVLVIVACLAFAARASARPATAGLFALSGVLALTVLVGALEAWFGWIDRTETPFGGFRVAILLIELVLFVSAMVARRVFRFPLLVFVAGGAGWYFLTDLVSNGGNWSAVVTLLYGIGALVVGLFADPVRGFWIHVIAGLAMGGAFLWFWHSSDVDWALVGIASLAYVWLAHACERSSYAVLGAFGLFLVASDAASHWFIALPTFYFIDDLEDVHPGHPWAGPLAYAVYGLVLMLLGLALARARGRRDPAALSTEVSP